ncbi:hypothetical protein BJ138DRAFT_1127202 [Hygrophoropsis aurantiaca]|uniref:Uncharacterized protein n=1 Tax=Hygrophoropsis aurantiaca TaxID=72124 RepID=A0ACB8A9W8_9AGAM|nr:hypothetical protein BJ138DRAFT_1127202 [Hygrophoropsis aurantiaca]
MLDKEIPALQDDCISSHHSLLRRIMRFAFDDNDDSTNLLLSNRVFYDLAYPLFLASMTFWTERAFLDTISRFGTNSTSSHGMTISCHTAKYVERITICFVPSSLRLPPEILAHFSKPVLFQNLGIVRFVFSYGVHLVPTLSGPAICSELAKHTIDNDDWLNPNSLSFTYLHALDPKRFEWASFLPSSVNGSTDRRFRLIGVHSNVRRLLRSWTNLNSIYLDGICLLNVDDFSACRVFLPVGNVYVSLTGLEGQDPRMLFEDFIATPGRITGTEECRNFILQRGRRNNTGPISDISVDIAFLYPGGTILSLQGFTRFDRTRFRKTFFNKKPDELQDSECSDERLQISLEWWYTQLRLCTSQFHSYYSHLNWISTVVPSLLNFVDRIAISLSVHSTKLSLPFGTIKWGFSYPLLRHTYLQISGKLRLWTTIVPLVHLQVNLRVLSADLAVPFSQAVPRIFFKHLFFSMLLKDAISMAFSYLTKQPLVVFQRKITNILEFRCSRPYPQIGFLVFLILAWLFAIFPSLCFFQWKLSTPTNSSMISLDMNISPILSERSLGDQCHSSLSLFCSTHGWDSSSQIEHGLIKASFAGSTTIVPRPPPLEDIGIDDEDGTNPKFQRWTISVPHFYPNCKANTTEPCSLDKCAIRRHRSAREDLWSDASTALVLSQNTAYRFFSVPLSVRLSIWKMKARISRVMKIIKNEVLRDQAQRKRIEAA